MFERFTEKAANRFLCALRGKPTRLAGDNQRASPSWIAARRKAVLRHLLLKIDYESLRNQIVARVQPGDLKLPLNVDLPLAEDAKLVLKFATVRSRLSECSAHRN